MLNVNSIDDASLLKCGPSGQGTGSTVGTAPPGVTPDFGSSSWKHSFIDREANCPRPGSLYQRWH